MWATIIWFIASAAVVDLIGYGLHRWSHRPSSPLYRAHMTHHLVAYPPKRITSQRYVGSGVDSFVIWFAPFGVAYAILVAVAGLPLLPIVIGGGLVALLNSVIHDRIHIEGSLVSRLLPKTTRRHLIHHRKMGRNFGILSSAWDRLFGTLWVSSKSRSPRQS